MTASFAWELTVAAETYNLSDIAEFIGACCQRVHVQADDAFCIELAVEEAATNIIEHAYGGEAGDLHLRCWVYGEDFYVELRDWGKAFDPEAVPPPNLSDKLAERPLGGLGLFFMRQLMDEVNFSFTEEGNRLVMIKRHVVP